MLDEFEVTICPHCGARSNGHDNGAGGRPHTGSVSLCWRCQKLAIFEETLMGLRLRLPTELEMWDLAASSTLQRQLAAADAAATVDEAVQRWRLLHNKRA